MLGWQFFDEPPYSIPRKKKLCLNGLFEKRICKFSQLCEYTVHNASLMTSRQCHVFFPYHFYPFAFLLSVMSNFSSLFLSLPFLRSTLKTTQTLIKKSTRFVYCSSLQLTSWVEMCLTSCLPSVYFNFFPRFGFLRWKSDQFCNSAWIFLTKELLNSHNGGGHTFFRNFLFTQDSEHARGYQPLGQNNSRKVAKFKSDPQMCLFCHLPIHSNKVVVAVIRFNFIFESFIFILTF